VRRARLVGGMYLRTLVDAEFDKSLTDRLVGRFCGGPVPDRLGEFPVAGRSPRQEQARSCSEVPEQLTLSQALRSPGNTCLRRSVATRKQVAQPALVVLVLLVADVPLHGGRRPDRSIV
jgi:hypothetical protein